MTINNQDKKEIHELPEVLTLQAGMMVAVDSEPTGTKSFNLTTALEGKVDAPATTPAEGQVLTFNGSANTWATPPEGVYVLNYSEVTDISDLDLEKLKSLPTFLVVDESGYYVNLPHTAQGGSTSNRIDINEGMIFRLTEYRESTPPLYTFTSPYTGSFYGGSIGDYYNGLLKITLFTEPGNTYLYKSIQYEGEINTGSLNRGMPVPHTTYYSGDEDYGPWDSNATVNSSASLTKMYEFGNKARKQIELPPEILTRQLGSSSNAPTLKTMLGFDVDNNANSCRFGQMVLFRAASQMSNQAYPEQTPQDLRFMEFVMGNPAGNLDDDQRCMSISMTLKDSTGTVSSNRSLNYLVVPNTSNAIDANIVPNVLKFWTDSNGGHMDWKPVNEVPSSTSSDSGKVLTVAANGTPGWGNAVGFVKNSGALTDASTITATTLNNGFATLSTSQSALTIIDVIGTDEVVNFAIEITPSVNCALTIQKKVGDNSPVTLKHSVAGGNTLEANKTYQVTAVGNCWTLAEFSAS